MWGLRGHDVVNCIDGAGGRGSRAAEMVRGGQGGQRQGVGREGVQQGNCDVTCFILRSD